MRLGMWNRLAIVATVLATLILPAYYVFSENARATQLEQGIYDACTQAADKMPLPISQEYRQGCWDRRFGANAYRIYRAGWYEWRWSSVAALAGCALVYGLLWAVIATSKWVWRGRASKIPPAAT